MPFRILAFRLRPERFFYGRNDYLKKEKEITVSVLVLVIYVKLSVFAF